MKFKLLYFSFFVFILQNSFSQTITLDSTFGTNGKVSNSFSPDGDSFGAMVIQPDGKILVTGATTFSINGNIYIARFNANGTVDTGFGVNGTVLTQSVAETTFYNNMKLLNNGKILVSGSTSTNSNSDFFNFITQRFNSDGTIDSTFGTNGTIITDFAGKGDFASVVDIQSDGKIIVGGTTNINNNSDSCISVVRYFSDGTLDTTFGTNGKRMLNLLAPNSNDFLISMKILSDDSIIFGADTGALELVEDYSNFGILKVTSSGTIDTTFGNNGSVVLSFGGDDRISSINEYNGKIIVAGYSSLPGQRKIAMAKYLSNGTLDTTFGTNGIVYTNKNSSTLYDASIGLIVQNDGKLLTSGYTINGTNADFLLIRFNNDGTIDNLFNSIGYFTTDFNNNNDISGGLAIGLDNKIVCAGLTQVGSNYSTALARYSSGQLNNINFEKNNYVVYPNPFIDKIIIENNGKNLLNSTIDLFDITGRKLDTFNANNGNNLQISLGEKLPKGNYFLKITSEYQQETIKIIKK